MSQNEIITNITTAMLFFLLKKKSSRLRNDVPYLNQCGVDGLIVKKHPGKMTIFKDQQAAQLAQPATDEFAARLARSQPLEHIWRTIKAAGAMTLFVKMDKNY